MKRRMLMLMLLLLITSVAIFQVKHLKHRYNITTLCNYNNNLAKWLCFRLDDEVTISIYPVNQDPIHRNMTLIKMLQWRLVCVCVVCVMCALLMLELEPLLRWWFLHSAAMLFCVRPHCVATGLFHCAYTQWVVCVCDRYLNQPQTAHTVPSSDKEPVNYKSHSSQPSQPDDSLLIHPLLYALRAVENGKQPPLDNNIMSMEQYVSVPLHLMFWKEHTWIFIAEF